MSTVAFAAVFMLGCGSTDSNGKDDLDSRLVTGAGQAWMDQWPIGERDGFILNANGTYVAVNDRGGTWNTTGTGTWFTDGNVLTLVGGGVYNDVYGIYTVSGNTLMFGPVPFTRLSNVVIGGNVDGADGDDLDLLLVTGVGEAWMDRFGVGGRDGFILNSDGTYAALDDVGGIWNYSGSGTWVTNGNRLTLTGGGHYGGRSGTYSVSGDVLVFDGRSFDLLSGVEIGGDATGDGGETGNIIGAWSDDYGTCYNDGFLFRADGTVAWISDYECEWEIDFEGTYTVSGNSIEICFYGDCDTGTFTISGNNLDICDSDGCLRYIRVTATGLSKAQKAAKSTSVPVGDRSSEPKTRPSVFGGFRANASQTRSLSESSGIGAGMPKTRPSNESSGARANAPTKPRPSSVLNR
jgi:hypothetical protein